MSGDTRLDDLLLQWEELSEQGREVAPAELCKDSPDLLAELTRRIRALQAMNPVLRPESPDATEVESDPSATSPVQKRGNPRIPTLPGYEILGELGRGGMGVVYKARQTSLGRVVALKMVLAGGHASPEQLARFRAEALAVGHLQHPNIVQIYDVGEDDGRPFFAMEFVAGRNLDELLDGKAQPADTAAAVVETLARAMHYAHDKGIVHRDLKPGNVLVAEVQSPRSKVQSPEAGTRLWTLDLGLWTLKITDFGLAKRLNDTGGHTRTGAVMGTPTYMAPEQAEGRIRDIGPATDIYALGVILYEMLTGRLPFEGVTSWDTIHQVIAADPLPPSYLQPKVPRDLDTICLKCLEKEPYKRYATAGALADELHRFRNGEPVLARPLGHLGRAIKWTRRRPAAAALLAVSVLALLVFLVGGSLFTARLYQANEKAHRETEKVQQAVVQLHVTNGTRYLEDGDLFAALVWLAMALELETDLDRQLIHRARIAAILDGCPRVRQMWFHGSGVLWVEYSPDGSRVLTASDDNMVRQLDPSNGQECGPRLIHKRSVLRAKFSTDGRLIVTASADHTAAVWEADSGKRLATLPHDKIVRDASFNRAGTRVVTAGNDATAQVWDAVSGARIGAKLEHGGPVVRATFSLDGKRVLTASADGTARLWDADTGEPLPVAPLKHDAALTDAVFHPDGDRVLTASDDHTARLWDAATGKPLQTFRHMGAVKRAVFSAQGERVLTASADMTARIWDVQTGKFLVPSMRHLSTVEGAAFSPDGRYVATASDDNTARVWDAATGRPITPPLTHNGDVRQVAFSPDGRWIATASDDNTARVFSREARRPPLLTVKHNRAIWQASFRPDGRRIVTASADSTARIWDAATGAEQVTLRHGGEVFTAQFSPDGSRVVTASADGTARVWDAVTGKAITPPLKPEQDLAVRCAIFSPDGTRVATASLDHTARVWDAATGKAITPPLVHLGPVQDLAFNPDGRRLATASLRDRGRIWDTATGAEVVPPLMHERSVNRIIFSPDGARVATASDDKTARVWDSATGKAVTPPLRQTGPVQNVTFAPDGLRVVTASDDNTARVWDVATHQMLFPAMWHNGAVTQARFNSDGRRLLTVSEDGTAVVWDAATRVPLTPALSHRGWGRLTDARFHPDGQRVLTASVDGSACLWEFGNEHWPADDVMHLAQLLSGTRIDEKSSSQVPLEADALQHLWEDLRAKYPDEFR